MSKTGPRTTCSLAYRTATAYSPADVSAIKLMLMTDGAVFLHTGLLVAARAVSILK